MNKPSSSTVPYDARLQNEIRMLCRRRKIKLKELASMCNVSQNTVQRWIKRERFPDAGGIVNLCLSLQCGVGDLYQFVPDAKK